MPTYESLPAESPFFKGDLFQKMVGEAVKLQVGDIANADEHLDRAVGHRQVINQLFAQPPANDRQSGADGKQ